MGTWTKEIDVAGRWIRRKRVRLGPDLPGRTGERNRWSRWERPRPGIFLFSLPFVVYFKGAVALRTPCFTGFSELFYGLDSPENRAAFIKTGYSGEYYIVVSCI
jgi:hypothetical protein